MSDEKADNDAAGKEDKRLSSGQEAAKTTVVREQIDPALTRDKHIQTADRVEHVPVAKRFDSSLTRDKYQGSHQSAPKDLVTEQIDPALTREKNRPSSPGRHESDSLAHLAKEASVADTRFSQPAISGGVSVNLDNALVAPSTPKNLAQIVKGNGKGAPSSGR